MKKIVLNARLMKWIPFLTDFDLEFVNKKSIKGQVIIDQLAEAPHPNTILLYIKLLDNNLFGVFEIEDVIETEEFNMIMYFDGSHCKQEGGDGVVFFMLQGVPLPFSFKISFEFTNNNV